MKMKIKQGVAVVLTALLTFSLAGCGRTQTDALEKVDEPNLLDEAVSIISDGKHWEKAVDDSDTTFAALNQGDMVTVSFAEPICVNTVALREKGDNCRKFNIYAEDVEGQRTLLYSNDIIDKYLYCSFPDTKTEKLIFEIEATEGTVKLQDIALYCKKSKAKDFRVHAYYATWNDTDTYFAERTADEDLNKNLNLVTDVILIGNLYWKEDGTLRYPKDVWDKEIVALREIIGGRDVRIWACILNPRDEAGAIDNRASVKSINNNLDTLTDHILAFCREYQLDGVDFDWEYPRLPHVWSAYNKLLINLKPKLASQNIMLSSALGPWGNMMSKEARETLDFVNVMSYDWSKNKQNNHAEFYTCHYYSANYLLNRGFTKQQLVLGVPFYGNTTGKEYGQASYSAFEITDKGQNTGVVEEKEYYFNGYDSIYSKTAFTYDNDFAGMMLWNGQSDLPRENTYSLFGAMESAVENRKK